LVLGGDDGDECTYGAGYLKRQAVFSCLTCVPGGDAGVCTACCLACHDGHEVSHPPPHLFVGRSLQ
jgi:E3 ubiquitin-protein ligase UBR7